MLTVVRVLITDLGCLGMLLKDGHPFCWTMEDPQQLIPEGEYPVRMKGNMFEILTDKGVAFFAAGTTKDDAYGNILLGFKVYSPRCLTDTQKAISEFQKVIKNIKETTLVIRRL